MEFEKLREIVSNVMGVDVSEVTMDTNFTEDLGADSIDLYQIVMEIEDEFNVKIDTDSVSKVTTVGEALELLNDAVAAG